MSLQQHFDASSASSRPVSRRGLVQASVLLPVGLVASSGLLAGCGVLTSGDIGSDGGDADELISQAVGNEIALIQAIGAANYSGNKALAKQFNKLIEIHTQHALALNADAVIGTPPTGAPKQSPTQALSKVRAAQRSAVNKQKALALQAGEEDLAFQLAIISASEAQCAAHVAGIKP